MHWRRRLEQWRRRLPTWGGRKLWQAWRRRWPRQHLPAARTLERWVAQAQLSGPRRQRRRRGPVTVPAGRRLALAPNDVWTVDFKGRFRHDGEWLDKPALEKANAAHASMTSAWELTDGFYALKTNLELSRAKHLLRYCTRYRLLCYSQFCLDMGLHWPAGKLPLYMTTVRKEYDEVSTKLSSSYRKGTEFGSYLYVEKRPLGPLVACLEKPWADKLYKLAPEYVLQGMNHELTHQLLFESLRWNEGSNRREANFWAAEGIASYMEAWFWSEGGWQYMPMKGYPQTELGHQAISRCKQARNALEKLKPLAAFVAESYPEFDQAAELSYAQSAALAQFLLDAKGPVCRSKFLALLVEVHTCHDDASSFKKFFKDDDLGKLHSEFIAYLEGLKED